MKSACNTRHRIVSNERTRETVAYIYIYRLGGPYWKNILSRSQKSVFFILNKSNLMHNIPFIPGGIDNLPRDSRSISRDVSVLYIPYNTDTSREYIILIRHARLTDYRATNYQCRQV